MKKKPASNEIQIPTPTQSRVEVWNRVKKRFRFGRMKKMTAPNVWCKGKITLGFLTFSFYMKENEK